MIRSDKEIDDLARSLADFKETVPKGRDFYNVDAGLELIEWLRGAENGFSKSQRLGTIDMSVFLYDLQLEMDYAEQKHPGWPSDAVVASAVINEEVGKLTKVCLDTRNGDIDRFKAGQAMKKYAVRIGAMAFRFYSADDYDYKN